MAPSRRDANRLLPQEFLDHFLLTESGALIIGSRPADLEFLELIHPRLRPAVLLDTETHVPVTSCFLVDEILDLCERRFPSMAPTNLARRTTTGRRTSGGGDDPKPEAKKPGRPSPKETVRAEAERRIRDDLDGIPGTLKEWGTELAKWLAKQPDEISRYARKRSRTMFAICIALPSREKP